MPCCPYCSSESQDESDGQSHSGQASALASPMNVQQPSEPVSLSEARLHQGDAPPAYEEAVGMKTIDV